MIPNTYPALNGEDSPAPARKPAPEPAGTSAPAQRLRGTTAAVRVSSRGFGGVSALLILLAGCNHAPPDAVHPDVLKVPYQKWHEVAQPNEAGGWTVLGEADCQRYKEMSEWVMKRFGFKKNEFVGKTVLDIGCGPTGRLDWLDGSFIAVEPLAAAFRRLPWAHLEKYHKVYELPAETRIKELVGRVDMVISLNCLDHAYDLDAIVSNMAAYLKSGGRAFISVDVDKPSGDDPWHPLAIRHETLRAILERHGFVIEKEEQGNVADTDGGKMLTGLKAWGEGTAYHYWLKKP
jgi:SAM-dependent methyltransferase